jgi:hypothetical protein
LFKRFESGWLQAAEAYEFLGVLDVYCTPNTPGCSSGEPYCITSIANALANTIDPAEAECLVNRLWPGNARFAGAFLVKSDPDLTSIIMMLLEPCVKLRRFGEK